MLRGRQHDDSVGGKVPVITTNDYIQSILVAVKKIAEDPDNDRFVYAMEAVDNMIWSVIEDDEDEW